MSETAIDLDRLPEQMRWLVIRIGVPATLRLLKARGGTRIRIPRQQGERSETLVDLVGEKAARIIAETFEDANKDGYLYLPKAHKILQAARNRQICRERAAGATLTQLALKHDMTVAWVKKIVRDVEVRDGPRSDSQRDLFEAA